MTLEQTSDETNIFLERALEMDAEWDLTDVEDEILRVCPAIPRNEEILEQARDIAVLTAESDPLLQAKVKLAVVRELMGIKATTPQSVLPKTISECEKLLKEVKKDSVTPCSNTRDPVLLFRAAHTCFGKLKARGLAYLVVKVRSPDGTLESGWRRFTRTRSLVLWRDTYLVAVTKSHPDTKSHIRRIPSIPKFRR